MKTSTLALLLALAIGIAAACVHDGKNLELAKQDKRSEIIALWTQIRGWRLDAHMEIDPAPQTMLEIRKDSVQGAALACPDGHQVPTTCNDVCNLADAICDNAERICDIATELGPDDKLGQEKCQSSKASCREAKKKCCGCNEPKAPPT